VRGHFTRRAGARISHIKAVAAQNRIWHYPRLTIFNTGKRVTTKKVLYQKAKYLVRATTGAPVKPPIKKADLRRELESQMEAFLREGGAVHEIPRGLSGRDSMNGPLPTPPFIGDEPRESRTYVNDVVAAIEARRKPAGPAKPKPRRPRKKIIYDDFGEPLRWVWEE
jgi:hypothetical protein